MQVSWVNYSCLTFLVAAFANALFHNVQSETKKKDSPSSITAYMSYFSFSSKSVPDDTRFEEETKQRRKIMFLSHFI